MITINVGQCGVMMADEQWKQYCLEHHIDNSGHRDTNKVPPNSEDDTGLLSFFAESEASPKTFRARSIMVDFEQHAIDSVMANSPISNLYSNDAIFCQNHTNGAANNFATAHTLGLAVIDDIMDIIRKQTEQCSSFQGFFVNRSLSGGTGSGLTALILEQIAADYRKKSRVGFTVFSDLLHTTNNMEIYNHLLSLHHLPDHAELSFLFDNAKMTQLSMQYLSAIDTVSEKNELISKVVSSCTNPMRFKNETNYGNDYWHINDLTNRLICFPRLQYISCSMAPLTPQKEAEHGMNKRQLLIEGYVRLLMANENFAVSDVCNIIQRSCFDERYAAKLQMKNISELNQLGDYMTDGEHYMHPSFEYDRNLHLNMATQFHYHGNVTLKEAYKTRSWLRCNDKYQIIESGPFVARCRVHNAMPETENGIVRMRDPMGFLFANNCAFGQVVEEGVFKKYQQMEHQANAKYLYLQHGLEKDQFDEAIEDIGFLVKDYVDCYSEYTTDEAEDEDDDEYYS